MAAAMTTVRMNETVSKNTSSNLRSLYKFGGTAALFSVLVVLTDIGLTFFPAGAEQPGTMTAPDWFQLFQDNWFFWSPQSWTPAQHSEPIFINPDLSGSL